MSSEIRPGSRIQEIGRLPGTGLRIDERSKNPRKKPGSKEKEEAEENGETPGPKGKVDLRA